MLARELKEAGLVPELRSSPTSEEHAGPLRVRIRAARPRAGFCHPAAPAEVREVLAACGARCTYGLRTVELLPGRSGAAARRLRFGMLRVPGRIVLYDQLPSPWLLPGMLRRADADRLTRSGAMIETDPGGVVTRVTWPDPTLRDFMLFDVLLHELAHHVLQQYTGKRTAQVARTRDHEAYAAHFVAVMRSALPRALDA